MKSNKKNFSSLISSPLEALAKWGHLSLQKGFTLIELLIVIAVLGVLAGGIVVVIDPISKINSANLAKVETFDASIQNSLSINLVGEWTFDGNTNDTSGYGNNGTVNGGAALTPDRRGRTDKAYDFNAAAGGTIYVANTAILNPGSSSFTLSAWIFRDSVTGANVPSVIGKGDTVVASKYTMYVPQDNALGAGKLGFYIKDDDVNGNNAVDSRNEGTVVLTNAWHHVVIVVDRTNAVLKGYVDGVQDIPDKDISSLTGGITNTMNLGIPGERVIGSGAYFDGKIDDVRIYNQALGLSQIQQLYAQGIEKHKIAVK